MSVSPVGVGFVTVSTPGTPVPLTAKSTPCIGIRVQPRQSASVINVGNVYLGGSNLSKNTPSTIYAVLSPEQVEGQQISSLSEMDLANWFVDADNAGDGVCIGYLKK